VSDIQGSTFHIRYWVSPTGKVKKNVFLVGTKQMLCEQSMTLDMSYGK